MKYLISGDEYEHISLTSLKVIGLTSWNYVNVKEVISITDKMKNASNIRG